jgi:hypothetical protein
VENRLRDLVSDVFDLLVYFATGVQAMLSPVPASTALTASTALMRPEILFFESSSAQRDANHPDLRWTISVPQPVLISMF